MLAILDLVLAATIVLGGICIAAVIVGLFFGIVMAVADYISGGVY
jgi:hypothetical protein